jgi:hypothetical protein
MKRKISMINITLQMRKDIMDEIINDERIKDFKREYE